MSGIGKKLRTRRSYRLQVHFNEGKGRLEKTWEVEGLNGIEGRLREQCVGGVEG